MTTKRPTARTGAYAVEFAFVAIILVMALFAIIEYSRFVFIRQMIGQAAREGARYAVVNTTATTIEADTIAFVKKKMSSVDGMVQGYQCLVYEGDSTGAKTGPAADAGFGEYVVVQIDCEYKPLLPNLLFMNSTMKLSSKSLMFSEAN